MFMDLPLSFPIRAILQKVKRSVQHWPFLNYIPEKINRGEIRRGDTSGSVNAAIFP